MLGSLDESDDAVQEAWLRLSRTDDGGDRQPRRLADHRRRSRLPRHAPRPARTAGGLGRRLAPGADRQPSTTSRSRAGGAARRLGRARAARRARDADARPSGSPSSCTTCSPSRSTRSPRSSTAAPTRPASSPAGPAAGFAARAPEPDADLAEQRRVVDAFLAASRDGRLRGLLAVLDPDVVLRADRAVPRRAPGAEVRGAREVARAMRSPAAARAARAAGARQRRRRLPRRPARTGCLRSAASPSSAGGSPRSTSSPTRTSWRGSRSASSTPEQRPARRRCGPARVRGRVPSGRRPRR